MARIFYPLCLLAIACPVAAKLPARGGDGSTLSSGQFAKIASAAKPNTRAATKNNEDEPDLAGPDLAQADSRGSPSVSAGVGAGGASLLQKVLSTSTEPFMRTVSFGAQLVIGCYLAKASWNVMKEVWDEVNEEFTAARKSRMGGGDVREEQDMPFADADAISGGLEEGGESDGDGTDEGDSLHTGPKKPWQSNESSTPQTTATRELARRLRSAGIPYASEISADDKDGGSISGSTCTVEEVVGSLTRAEGNVLSQTLLTPLDGGLLDGGNELDSATAAAAAWNAIGGLEQAKESLLDLAFPLLPQQSASNKNDYYGGLLANPPGVLLYGPPGCGKSMLVRALAATVGARFVAVSPSCLLRKYVGETNLNVRALFSAARKISPCFIFVDELDGLFRERGGEDHDVGRDLKTEFLQLWDGIRHQGGTSSSVLVIGATNRPFDVDAAFLRRMPRRVFVGLPDYESRVSVLQSMLSHVPLDATFDLSLVASRTGGYSPSDIRELLQSAALYPMREARAEAMALEVTKPTHFSRRYQRDLMNYARSSGGSFEQMDSPSFPEVQEQEDATVDYYDEGESDAYSYDDGSSDSEYDDL
ncbi:hypothetical protein ACHAXT_008136 [Thalassiosira profunda]